MRSLIIALLLIVLITAGCAVTAKITGTQILSITDSLEGLTLDNSFAPLQKKWDELKAVLEHTAVRRDIQQIDDAFLRTVTAHRHRNEHEFDIAKSTLIYLMKELRLTQVFSAKRIL